MRRKWHIILGRKPHFRIAHQAFFFATLSELVTVGFSIRAGLDFVATVSASQQTIVKQIQDKLIQGSSLPAALQQHLPVPTYQQLKLADEHGDLVQGMTALSRFLQLRQQQRQKLLAASLYPLCLLGILGGVFILIKTVLLPQTTTLLAKPAPATHWEIVLFLGMFGIGGLVMGLRWWRRQTRLSQANLLIRIPLLGGLFRSYYAYYLTANLALLFQSGLEMREMVKILTSFEAMTFLAEIGHQLKRGLQQGESLSEILSANQFVGVELCTFFDNGSSQTALANNLSAYSELCFQKLIRRSNQLIGMIQPIAFVIIGGLIGLTYLQMLLPMYQSLKGVY
ncbi:Late competence protein ComGB, access of DNA to ComEA [Fructilactobacillus florum 8D]|uniref:Late competence protein ComGB, access of DNA to ComEA n=1 Tax=Fructilactobacillus florum 8D TaxID=1221538 RepID=W9EG17_9LACO|nr:type II secretion system F family protein [Fructilactobacillus florum]ETO39915.1 Late competence protein ComGB, access of DNA to ComEA [Fructilactobacillus florum 8D]